MLGNGFLGQVRLAQPGSPAPASAPGPVGSPGREWWIHHIRNTRAYLEAALAGDQPASLAALKELWNAVKDWESITQSWAAGLLIAEHTALAKLLVDCFAQGLGNACTGTAADALARNVAATRQLFPVNPDAFADLYDIHTQLAGQYITDLAGGNQEDFERHFAEALQNGEDLGAFTDQAFFGK